MSEGSDDGPASSAGQTRFPWPRGAATGIGSYPGDDPAEAIRVVLGELPDLPHLPELPGRGPGADMIGRSAALLVDLAVGLQPSGWRFTDRPGRDTRRARDFLDRDLDRLEELAEAYEGPLKVQVAGPWTLAGAIELRHGDKALADPGAVRDLTESLAEGVAGHVADVARRVPGATILVQLDEGGLPGVLAGTVPTASGFGRLAAVAEPEATEGLRAVLAAAVAAPVGASGVEAFPLVHCCAPGVPYDLLRAAGARAISFDVGLVAHGDDDALGAAVEAGVGLFLGLVPALGASGQAGGAPSRGTPLRGPNGSGPASAARGRPASSAPGSAGAGSAGPVPGQARRAARLWRRLGFAPELLPEMVVVTPTCGLAGASPAVVQSILSGCRETARALSEDPEPPGRS